MAWTVWRASEAERAGAAWMAWSIHRAAWPRVIAAWGEEGVAGSWSRRALARENMSRARVRRSGVEEGAVEFIFLGDEELELRLRGESCDLLEPEVERGGVRGREGYDE